MDIIFYCNVKNREYALCQLLGKALKQNMWANLFTESQAASKVLDQLLWEIPQTGFIAHCAADDPRASRTPVIIDYRPDLLKPRALLFNWTQRITDKLTQYEKIIEIIGTDQTQQYQAQERWKAYEIHGYTPRQINIQASPDA